MSLVFPYWPFPTTSPAVTLGGRRVRPRPIVPVTIIGPTGGHLADALLDTGADETIFPSSVATHIGINLTGAPVGGAAGVGLVHSAIRYAEVTLRVAQGRERREWRAWVGFTATPLRQPLLGFAGFLQFFTATSRGDREEVELAVNALYPGT